MDLVDAKPLATTQTTNTLSWNFTNLLPFETRDITFTLNLNSPMETPAVNCGSVLPYVAHANARFLVVIVIKYQTS